MAYSSNRIYGHSKPQCGAKPSGGITERPSTLNLVSGSSSSSTGAPGGGTASVGSTSTGISGCGNSSSSKPYRYTSALPTLQSIQAKSSSITNIPRSTFTGPQLPSYAPSYNYGQSPRASTASSHEANPTPSKSSLGLGFGLGGSSTYRDRNTGLTVPYYQTQMMTQRLSPPAVKPSQGEVMGSRPPGTRRYEGLPQLSVSSNYGVATSKSAQNLMDSIPDVFCLSCPPAEFKFYDAYRAKTLPRTGKENEMLIGFATLPEQVHRKSVKKGFDFTLMAVGESGLGKSTLINSLFLTDFYQNRKVPSVIDQMKRTTSIQKHTIEIEERGVKLRLTVVDTPGFGDSINCVNSWKACVDHIDDQFHQYFQAESGLNRRHIQDTRVHCCLYFVPPYGRGLRPLDVDALKNLQTRVNIIPVIAKADTLTRTEVEKLKSQILDDLKTHQIQIYQFPDCDEYEDEEFKQQDRELKNAIPFAVTASDIFVEVGGKKIRGRAYPWGIVEVENPNHSDFGKLRTMLIQTHMHDLKETTKDLHYENFRAKAIAQISQRGSNKERNKLMRDSSLDSPHELLQQKEAEIKKMQQKISKMEAKLKTAGHSQVKSPVEMMMDLL